MASQFLLSYPFRIDYNNERFGTVDSGSDTYKAQQISAFLRTEKSERPLFPSFGIEDPVFNTFDSADFIDSFIEFYPSDRIEITEIRVTDKNSGSQDVAVGFK